MLIKSWESGSAYQNLTSEAKALMGKWLRWCDKCGTGAIVEPSCTEEPCRIEKRKLLNQVLDITDTRTICLVMSKETSTVRQFLIVSDDAEDRLEELKAEFYVVYHWLPDDEFHFFKGLHRAIQYAE